MYIVETMLFFFGCWFVIVGSQHSVSSAVNNAVAKRKVYSGEGRADHYIETLAARLQPYITLGEARRNRYNKMLKAAGNRHNADGYISVLAVESLLCVAVSIALAFVSILFPLIGIGLGVFLFWQRLQALGEEYQRYQTEVEMDLPKLCSVINSRLSGTKNVQEILRSFLPIASPAMREEIAITLADMKTGSQTIALLRLESRLGSPRVNDVVRGLISVINGDDQTVYFQSKQHQFNNDYLTVRKKEIQQRPLKLTMPSIVAFLFFFLMVAYPLLAGMSTTMTGIL